MERYSVRVLLYDAEDDNKAYEQLHTAMEEKGFHRWIKDDDTDIKYQLPQAEYNIYSDLDKAGVLSLAGSAAQSVRRKFSVVVTTSNGRTWVGLNEYVEKTEKGPLLILVKRQGRQ